MFKFFKNKKVYLDNAASTPVLPEVTKYLKSLSLDTNLYYNPSAIYQDGLNVKSIMYDCRKSIANNINCRHNEIFFTSGGTESISLGLRGYIEYLYYYKLQKSRKVFVLTTNIEHPAVIDNLLEMQNRGIAQIELLPVSDNGILSSTVLRDTIQKYNLQNIDIDLISVIFVNNEIGTIQNIKDYGHIIDIHNRQKYNNFWDNTNMINKQNHKTVFFVDACQALNYIDIDVRKLRVDMLVINSSKLYAGKGCGILYKNKNIKISTLASGGGQEGGIRSGTENISSIIAIAKAIEIINNKDNKQKEIQRLRDLQIHTIQLLKSVIPQIEFWPPIQDYNIKNLQLVLSDKTPNNINFSLSDFNSDEAIIRLDYKGFQVSHKSACDAITTNGSYVLQAIGATEKQSVENIRITMGRYTTVNDMIKFVNTLKQLYIKYKK